MSTEIADATAPTPASTPTPAPASTPVAITIIAADQREEFDALFRELTGVPTPLPITSEALHATDPAGNTAGVAYLHVRHLVSPYALTEGTSPDVLDQIIETITNQLRATVREAVTATHLSGPDVAAPRGLSYDIYVPRGQEPPASTTGAELLPVEVWRVRVC